MNPRKFDLSALLAELRRRKMTRREIMEFCGITQRPADTWISRLYNEHGLKSEYAGEPSPRGRTTYYWLPQ